MRPSVPSDPELHEVLPKHHSENPGQKRDTAQNRDGDETLALKNAYGDKPDHDADDSTKAEVNAIRPRLGLHEIHRVPSNHELSGDGPQANPDESEGMKPRDGVRCSDMLGAKSIPQPDSPHATIRPELPLLNCPELHHAHWPGRDAGDAGVGSMVTCGATGAQPADAGPRLGRPTPNGWRLSGERAARVRCSRGLGALATHERGTLATAGPIERRRHSPSRRTSANGPCSTISYASNRERAIRWFPLPPGH